LRSPPSCSGSLDYHDYTGALQRFRLEHPREVEVLWMASFLMDYPFADRLFPGALKVVKRLSRIGLTVIPSDGDVVSSRGDALAPKLLDRGQNMRLAFDEDVALGL
jgi:hypothetical protein